MAKILKSENGETREASRADLEDDVDEDSDDE